MRYTEDAIQVLTDLEPVRIRPGMYIGSTSSRGLHHMVYEIVDNAVDEALAGFCDKIQVYLNEDGSCTVKDNGRGIPVGIHKETGKSALELVFTTLHAGSKFNRQTYKISGGLHGVGASVVNALSEWLEVEVYRDGKIFFQRYESYQKPGIPVTGVIEKGKTSDKGTKVTFKPDKDVFDTVVFNFDTLASRFKEMTFLNPGLTIELYDLRPGKQREVKFCYYGGISEMLTELVEEKDLISEIFYCKNEKDGVEGEFALVWANENSENIYSYVNSINTIEGGTHETGFKQGITKTINKLVQDLMVSNINLAGEDIRSGLIAIIAMKIPEVQFEGQTKTKLGNSEIKSIAENLISEKLEEYFLKNHEVLRNIVNHAIEVMKTREANRKSKENSKKQKVDLSAFKGKLAECSSKNAKERELFLVEGDSAGGSAKQGRDRKYQAILPLRGKILNIEKADTDKIFANEEIKAIVNIIGCGINEECDPEKSNYGKIIIMTDADDDGGHIRSLLMTMFYRFMRPLILEGMLYVARPPLYRVTYKKETHYLYSDKELNNLTKNFKEGSYTVQRYKGLGEMNPEQLWETTMNPETRTLIKVTINDILECEEKVKMLLGNNIEKRKEFIINQFTS